MIRFSWDDAKAKSNLSKHKVSFEEAETVFYDDLAIQFFDEDHSDAEDRFILLGCSNTSRVLIVCHCERDGPDHVRIISARKATYTERSFYEGE